MAKYFNVYLEFDKNKVDGIIEDCIQSKDKGYVCVIESNNLTVANTDERFFYVVNNSMVNVCDGSVIAMFLGKIHNEKLSPYLGNDLFEKYISEKKYKHYFLGNTVEVLNGLKKKLSEIDNSISSMSFESLPFMAVDDFDYPSIAQKVNASDPDFIWVSLGAPKQELFMNKLLPYLNRGVMVGVGAVFNFHSGVGAVKRAPLWMRRIKLEWLYRAFEEPQKNIPRYWGFIKVMPSLLCREILSVRKK